MKKMIKSLAVLVVLFLGFCLFILSNHLGGWRAFVVMSGSMEPTVPIGSLVVTKQTTPDKLHKNDIITFIQPTREREFVTHRINKITNQNKVTIIKTKGDHNKSQDPWILAGGGVVGKVQFTIPFLGYVVSFAKTKPGVIFFILIPAVLIILDQINIITTLLKTNQTQKNKLTDSMACIIFMGLCFSLCSFQPTHALLSDKVELQQNVFTLECNPAP